MRIALVVGIVAVLATPANAVAGRQAAVLDIDGAIGPGIADYVVRALGGMQPSDTGVVVLRLDTPGGLDTSMRDIVRAILASPVPVVAYVAPSGARAASAGTYIAYACGIAAMAPGTNIGAATPIQLGGSAPPTEPGEVETRKILNDAVAYIHSLAELNGRNADWAVEAVRSAVSLPASEALRLKVIDVVADDVPDLLRKIDGRTVMIAGKPIHLATGGLEIVTMVRDWRTQLLEVITDPNIAYLLMLLGAYGLLFELANPGTVLPGIIGGISLLVALFALNMLPVDYAGAGLVLLGIALMVAEAVIGAFGVIGVGGIVAFALGSVLMFHADAPGFGLSLSLVGAATVVSAGFFLLVLSMLLRSRRRPVITGREALIGAEGEAVVWAAGEGSVRVKGEIWRARASHPLQPGVRVKVVHRDGLVLTVEPSC
jgi:membrane-bound serine protease (ClpP class)